MGRDAVYTAVKYRASSELIAELVVRCLESGVPFNGWHYLLQHDSCSSHVKAVIKLVQEEASEHLPHAHYKSTRITEQLTSPVQEAVAWLSMSLDSMQRTAMNVATKQNCTLLEKGMLYLGRFWTAEAVMVHESETSTILLTEDVKQKSSAAAFVKADVGKEVTIEGDAVKIGSMRRDIRWGVAKHHDCMGTIKSVEETYKGKVKLEDGQEFENGGAEGERRIALKLMKNEEEWHREQDMRKTSLPIDKHVIEMLESCVDKMAMQSVFTSADVGKVLGIIGDDVKLDDTPIHLTWGDANHCDCIGQIESVEENPEGRMLVSKGKVRLVGGSQEFENPTRCKDPRPFLIVMPAAQMDLSDFLSHNCVAGMDIKAVVAIMQQVGQHVQSMHTCGRIHGDLKPRNIVKIEEKWFVPAHPLTCPLAACTLTETDKRTDRWMHAKTDSLMQGQTDGRIDRLVDKRTH